MRLLSVKKSTRARRIEDDEKQVAQLRLEKARLKEQKEIAELKESWEPEKQRIFKEFCTWNKGIQEKKAKLLMEIDELEKKLEVLVDNIKIHI